MSTLPVDRTTNNTVSEHLADHNELHRLHNVWDGHAPSDFILDSRRVWASGNLTGLATDKYVASTPTTLSSSPVYTLPDASTVADGHLITISDEGQGVNGSNILTITPHAGDTLTPNFFGSNFVTGKGGKITIVKAGDNTSHAWYVVSELSNLKPVVAGTGITVTNVGSNQVVALTGDTTPSDGWIQDSLTWTQTGALTFTTAGNTTNYLKKGTRIKVNDSTIKYGVIGNSVYNGTTTTTITLIDNDDYALVANPSSRWFSRMPDPEGFPFWFNYITNSTIVGLTDKTGVIQRWCTNGRLITMEVAHATAQTSTATGYTVSLPIASANIGNSLYGGSCFRSMDNSAVLATQPFWQIGQNQTIVTFFLGTTGAWTASGTKRASALVSWEF